MQTAQEFIQAYVINQIRQGYPEEFGDKTQEEIEDSDYYQDYLEEFRQSGERSFIKSSDFSRHYENEEVARVLDIGGEKVAVGWTYWTGGGKYGEPQTMPWLERAYFCDCTQETRVVDVFTKK